MLISSEDRVSVDHLAWPAPCALAPAPVREIAMGCHGCHGCFIFTGCYFRQNRQRCYFAPSAIADTWWPP